MEADGTPPAVGMEADNNSTTTWDQTDNSVKTNGTPHAKLAYMKILLEAMSPENRALIIMPTEAPVPKVCKQLSPRLAAVGSFS